MRRSAFCAALLWAQFASADGLTADSLGIVFNRDDAASVHVAMYYAERRHVPAENVVGVSMPNLDVIDRHTLTALRTTLLEKLPPRVQSLAILWSRPTAVECMSITTAVAAGYRATFCEGFCARTAMSPLYDSSGWLPADSVGWLPAMLLPTDDETLAKAVIDRGIRADASMPSGTVYLVRTHDVSRNVRAAEFDNLQAAMGRRIEIRQIKLPLLDPRADVLVYFTGVPRVEELPLLSFRAGAAADHLTSYGGMLSGSTQMSALEWLRQGATASYGTVSEPCNYAMKFPSPSVFLRHYLRGDSLLEAYWKSVAMPGQGLFIGEPLARPYAVLR